MVENNNPLLDEFNFYEILGNGSFGIVHKVSLRTSRQFEPAFFALKWTAMESEEEIKKDRESRVNEQLAEKAKDIGHFPNLVKQWKQWSSTMNMNEAQKMNKAIRLSMGSSQKPGGKALEDWAGSEKIKGKSQAFFRFYLLEMCSGSLRDHIDKIRASCQNSPTCTVDNHQIGRILGDVFLGLRELHKRALIHRDLKPRNILRGYDNNWKIADFGLATKDPFHNEEGSKIELTESEIGNQQNAGTQIYKAPEVEDGHGYSSKIDMFSLGLTYIELVVSHENLNFMELKDILSKTRRKGLIDATSENVKATFQKCGHTPDHFDLTKKLVEHDPKERLDVTTAIKRFRDLPIPANTTIFLKSSGETVFASTPQQFRNTSTNDRNEDEQSVSSASYPSRSVHRTENNGEIIARQISSPQLSSPRPRPALARTLTDLEYNTSTESSDNSLTRRFQKACDEIWGAENNFHGMDETAVQILKKQRFEKVDNKDDGTVTMRFNDKVYRGLSSDAVIDQILLDLKEFPSGYEDAKERSRNAVEFSAIVQKVYLRSPMFQKTNDITIRC